MKVTVQLNGILATQSDWREKEFSVTPGATLVELQAAIEDDLGQQLFSDTQANIGINDTLVVDGEVSLHDGDRIAFFPPLAGG